MSSVNNNIPFVPENTIDPAAGLNESINVIDALLQLRVVSVGTNTPPGSPTNGARYIVGTSPTGAWAGQANKLARWLDSTWSFSDAVIAVNQADGAVWVRQTTTWAALAGGGGGVTSVALSAPTGFSVSGSPVTTSGTFTLAFAAGYSLPTTAEQGNWSTAFGWGNHAAAGYEYKLVAGTGIAIDRTNPLAPVISATGGGGGMANPMTTEGDIIVGRASGVPARLGLGANGYYLSSNGTTLEWVAAPSVGGAAWGSITGTLSAQTDLQAALDLKAHAKGLPFRVVTASGSITPADSGGLIISTASSAITLTVGAEATAAWDFPGLAVVVHFIQTGSGALTIAGDGFSIVLHSQDTAVLNGPGSVATAVRLGPDVWRLFGDLVSV